MRPYTRDDAEAEFRAALDHGDRALIDVAAAAVDRYDTAPPLASLLGAALWYAEQGLHVFPVQPGSKVPHPGTRGCKEATSDATHLRTWWARWPDSNIAVATGHVIDVVDFDGLAGHVSWGQLYGESWGGIARLATVSTPRAGGLHVWLAANPARRNKAGLLPGVDYRGAGGYVVVPPSTTPTGTYRFLKPYGTADPARLPTVATPMAVPVG